MFYNGVMWNVCDTVLKKKNISIAMSDLFDSNCECLRLVSK